MLFKRYFLHLEADEAADLFREQAHEYIARGDNEGLRQLYIKCTAAGMFVDENEARNTMRGALSDVVMSIRSRVKRRGRFDHMRPERFRR